MKAKYVKERQLNSKTVWVFQPPKKWQQAVGARFQRFDNFDEASFHSHSIHQAYIDFCISAEGKIYVDERTVGGLIHYYKTTRHYQERLRESSKTSYDLAFKKIFQAPPFKGCSKKLVHMESKNVTPDLADNIYQYFAQEITEEYAITVCRRLRRVWNVGFRKGLVEGNPFAQMGLVSKAKREVRWTPEEVERAIEVADKLRKPSIGTAIVMLYELAHSPVDIRNMRWGDIANGKIKFIRQKTGAELDIPLPVPLSERLEKVMPKNVAADEYIIKNETNGRPYTASVLQRHFRKIRLHANLPSELCLGDLRRTGATEMADSGCTNAEMKAVTGHKTLNVLALYARPTTTQAGNAINKRHKRHDDNRQLYQGHETTPNT